MSLQPLSQTQCYFLGVMIDEGFNPTWQHVALSMRLRGRLDAGRVEDVAQQIATRHPLLATRLVYQGGEPFLAPARDPTAGCQLVDLAGAGARELDLYTARRVDEPFDLLDGPLWRLLVVAAGPEETILTFVCHHLVGDGIAAWILVKDFGALYFRTPLDPLPPLYAQFVADERELLLGPAGAARMEYWATALDGAQPRMAIEERPGSDELSSRETVGLLFADDVGEGLVAGARARRVTPLALLCAAMFSALKRASGQQDVLAASVTDIRGARYAGTVGTFSDLVLVRDAAGDDDEQARLKRLRNAFFDGWRCHLPIASLREQLPCFVDPGLTSGNPCDVFLNFIPVRTSSDWFSMLAPYGDYAPEYYALSERIGSPTRRFAPPLLFFSFVHAMQLSGWVDVHRSAALIALAQQVADELPAVATALAAAPTR